MYPAPQRQVELELKYRGPLSPFGDTCISIMNKDFGITLLEHNRWLLWLLKREPSHGTTGTVLHCTLVENLNRHDGQYPEKEVQ